jgi:predicted Zn finger-like uncharacterized protein
MNVECPKCKKKYKVDEKLIPAGGAPVRCPACSNIFTLYRAPIDIPLEPVAQETVPEPGEETAAAKETAAPTQAEPSVAETTAQATENATSEGIETTVPPKEQRTKLWEKLQETYKAEKKSETTAPQETPTTTQEPPISEEPTTVTEEPPVTAEEKPTAEPTAQEPSEIITEEPVQEEVVEEEPTTEEGKVEKEAKRLARSLVKDILLYHSDKVEIGLKQGNLAQLIGDEIRKSWKFYKDNFPLEKTNGVNYFKKALNEIIGKGKPIFK